MKKLILAIAAIASLGVPVAAQARDHRYDGYYGRHYDNRYGNRYDNRYRGYYDRNTRRYYNNDRRYDRRCNNGTTGTVLGAVAGGLLGRTIDQHGDRTLGTVVGAGGGALAGRALTRNCR
jgi:hypothetical protein